VVEGAVLQQQGDVLSAPSGDTNAVVHVARGLKVFLSYSRKDLDSADQMVPALEAFGHVVSIDREDIFGAERWEERLGQMILEADTVVFLLTPSSAESRACYWEVEQALAQRKRIVPVIAKPLAGAKPHEALRALNYIYFCPDPSVPTAGWGSGLKRLHSTLTVDILWIREHTHIAEMAARWLAERSNEDLLVRGSELVQLQKWRAVRPTSAPELTPQQRGFLEASENAEMLRQDRERQQIEEMRVAQAVKAEALAAQEISGGIAWRNWQKAEQALLRVKDEQLLQDRLIRLARNKEFPSPPYSIDILAKRYEGEGPGDIGTDFMGSVYYGIYRIKADANMEEFLTFSERWGKPLYNKLAAAGGKVAAIKRDPRFIEAWRSLATDAISAAQFAKLQTDFVTRSGYERLAARLKAGYPLRPGQTAQVNLDVGTRSLALRAVIFSVAVQYGPSTRLLQDALSELGDLSMQKDEVIISRIYELRNNVASYFPELQSHSPNFVELIKERNHWEERDALQILSRERS